MTILCIRGREMTGPVTWARATAMARSYCRHWGLDPADISFL